MSLYGMRASPAYPADDEYELSRDPSNLNASSTSIPHGGDVGSARKRKRFAASPPEGSLSPSSAVKRLRLSQPDPRSPISSSTSPIQPNILRGHYEKFPSPSSELLPPQFNPEVIRRAYSEQISACSALIVRLTDDLSTAQIRINTLMNREPSLDEPSKRVARLEVAVKECRAIVDNWQSLTDSDRSINHHAQGHVAAENLEHRKVDLKTEKDQLAKTERRYQAWQGDIIAQDAEIGRLSKERKGVQKYKEHLEFLDRIAQGGPRVTKRLVAALKEAQVDLESIMRGNTV